MPFEWSLLFAFAFDFRGWNAKQRVPSEVTRVITALTLCEGVGLLSRPTARSIEEVYGLGAEEQHATPGATLVGLSPHVRAVSAVDEAKLVVVWFVTEGEGGAACQDLDAFLLRLNLATGFGSVILSIHDLVHGTNKDAQPPGELVEGIWERLQRVKEALSPRLLFVGGSNLAASLVLLCLEFKSNPAIVGALLIDPIAGWVDNAEKTSWLRPAPQSSAGHEQLETALEGLVGDTVLSKQFRLEVERCTKGRVKDWLPITHLHSHTAIPPLCFLLSAEGFWSQDAVKFAMRCCDYDQDVQTAMYSSTERLSIELAMQRVESWLLAVAAQQQPQQGDCQDNDDDAMSCCSSVPKSMPAPFRSLTRGSSCSTVGSCFNSMCSMDEDIKTGFASARSAHGNAALASNIVRSALSRTLVRLPHFPLSK